MIKALFLLQNFRDALQEMWRTSMSHLSRVPVVFEGSSACVRFQPPNEGWKMVADAQQCNVSRQHAVI